MEIRPPSNIFIAWIKPSPTAPSRLASGMRQSWKIISAVSLARIPSLFSFLPALKPLVPRSTAKAVIPCLSPFSPVRAITTAMSPLLPWVMKFLVPLSTHSSPSFTAVVAIPPESEPVLCSVMPHAPIHSPEANLGNQRCFCSSLPKLRM